MNILFQNLNSHEVTSICIAKSLKPVKTKKSDATIPTHAQGSTIKKVSTVGLNLHIPELCPLTLETQTKCQAS
jgi:hypothetical protein